MLFEWHKERTVVLNRLKRLEENLMHLTNSDNLDELDAISVDARGTAKGISDYGKVNESAEAITEEGQESGAEVPEGTGNPVQDAGPA